jgi:hypothetical protein
MTTPQQREEKNRRIATVSLMLRTNIAALRASVVLDKPDMMMEIINEMDKTIEELVRLVIGNSN